MNEKRYGYNDREDGTTVLWETADDEPFTHIAEIHDWDAFIRWLYTKRSGAWERCMTAVEAYANRGFPIKNPYEDRTPMHIRAEEGS